MKIHTLLAYSIIAAIASGESNSQATTKKAPSQREEPNEFTVEIPRSELGLAQQPTQSLPSHEKVVEVTVSAYEPRSFTRPSYAGETSRLSRGKLPLVSVGAAIPVLRLVPGVALDIKTNFAYSRMERRGPSSKSYVTDEIQQVLNLLLLRSGPELRGPAFFTESAEPFLGVALAPSFLFGPASPYENSVSTSGLGYEGSAGVRLFPAFLTGFLGGGQGSIVVGMHYLAGNLGGSSLRGLSSFLGLGVSL